MKRSFLTCVGICLVALPISLFSQSTNSLHYSRKGKAAWYGLTNGGFETLTNVPYSSLKCNGCHGDSLATGVPVIDSLYSPGCNDCHATFSAGGVPSPKACLKCHSRQGAEINYARTDTTYADVHTKKGMTCIDCHKKEELHKDATAFSTMLDPGVIEAKCQNQGCHPTINVSYTAHTVHGDKLDCTACHTKSVLTCYSCHFETELATGGKIKRPIGQLRGFVMLANRSGKVYASTFMALTYKGKAFYTIAPYTSHSIVKQGRGCQECHNNAVVQQYKQTGKIILTQWDAAQKRITNTKGVIPVPPDWRQAFQFDFVTYTGDSTQPTDATKWAFLKSSADLSQMLPQYADTLTSAQMAKLATPVTSLGEEKITLPKQFQLSQNYPNPFNPSTRIAFSLPKESRVSLQVFDMMGRVVATLVDEVLPAGRHAVVWNGRASDGRLMASGIYFYRLKADGYIATRKMMLQK